MRPMVTIKVERGMGDLVVDGGGACAIHVLVQVPNRSAAVLFARPIACSACCTLVPLIDQ